MSIPLDYVENNSNNTDYHSNDGDSNDIDFKSESKHNEKKNYGDDKIIIIQSFCIVPFSAFEQTQCAH